MNLIGQAVIGLFGFLNLALLVQAYYQCGKRKNSYGNTPFYAGFLGAFVWADALIFAVFWFLLALAALILDNLYFFLLGVSLFWLIRAIGETIYWFFQQFTPRKGNEPQKFFFYRFVKNDSVYFMMQIYWQCMTVIMILTSLYLTKLWLSSLT